MTGEKEKDRGGGGNYSKELSSLQKGDSQGRNKRWKRLGKIKKTRAKVTKGILIGPLVGLVNDVFSKTSPRGRGEGVRRGRGKKRPVMSITGS